MVELSGKSQRLISVKERILNVKESPKFRLFVVGSIIWLIIAALVVMDQHSYFSYRHFVEGSITFFIITSPVWLFWCCFWIWKGKFESFFSRERAEQKKNNAEALPENIKSLSRCRHIRWAFYFIPCVHFLIFLFLTLIAETSGAIVGIGATAGEGAGIILVLLPVINLLALLVILFYSYKILVLIGLSKVKGVVYTLLSVIPIIGIVMLIYTEIKAAKMLQKNLVPASVAIGVIMPILLILTVFFNAVLSIHRP